MMLAAVTVVSPTNTAPVWAGPPAEPIVLWPDGAPGAVSREEVDVPTLTPYVPATRAPTRTSVVICPGGGYATLAMDHEGAQVAEFFNRLGIVAFVLKYRLGPRYHHPSMLQDAQRAIRYVRAHADAYGASRDRVGIIGFSAGGHLASTAATHTEAGRIDAPDPIERESARPDFLILGYPVVTFVEAWTHEGSRDRLLADEQTPERLTQLSNERQVTKDTPPTFLFHTNADTGVPPENSVMFYLALRRAGVPAELHIYERGRHGVGLAPDDPVLSSWPDRLADWLKVRGLL
ncbi:MAG: alpha/beta hydrolase fold domain-containing protein [Luteitalea sp.]|nr:alpha/beta hydrolase fold domain-containing protein [Luteitalea sp.]